MIALYIWSVYEVFAAPNPPLTHALVCVPIFGQLLWVGVSLRQIGLFAHYAIGWYVWLFLAVVRRFSSRRAW